MGKTNPAFLNGVPELLLLKLLSRREMYGYEIVKAIQTQTREILTFGEGCIYPYLHYLEEEKLVASRHLAVDGRDRVYYQLTGRGCQRLEQLTQEWDRVTRGVALVLGRQHA
jgi:PadR family transcriptional regulator, regulatory protein PadR